MSDREYTEPHPLDPTAGCRGVVHGLILMVLLYAVAGAAVLLISWSLG